MEQTAWASPIYGQSTIKMLVQHTTSSWIRIKCCTPHSSFGFSLNLGRCSLLPSPPFSPSSFTSWLAHVQQTASVSPGTVHRAPHRCGRPLLPRAAPLGADSVHIVPARGRNQWPRLLYRGSRVLVMLPWKSCRCFGEREGGGRERRNKKKKKKKERKHVRNREVKKKKNPHTRKKKGKRRLS